MLSPAEQTDGHNGTSASFSPLPAIAAAFLVKFDERKGYVLAWHMSSNDSNLDGFVEFKSMPSGLHNVESDVVYFVHEDCIGISFVLNVEDETAARKARIIALGVLVPLQYGRMGKSWLYADPLKELAEKQIKKDEDYTLLEQFWEEHKVSASPEPIESADGTKAEPGELTLDTNLNSASNGYQVTRSMSAVPPTADFTLPSHHPALAISDFLRLFGPLAFPLVRAAMLRKRILILGEAPVERTCTYVYNLSIMSSLPRPIATLLPNLDPTHIRLKPLFNIGISDIPYLESSTAFSGGWIACTTDDVLCTKPGLFDVLVVLPGASSEPTKPRSHPKIYFSSSELASGRPKQGLRATQRDAKRFVTLWKGLQSIPPSREQQTQIPDSPAVASSSETSPDVFPALEGGETASIASTVSSAASLKSVVEPQSWSRIAYTSLLWWASAGDKRGGLSEAEENENEQDVALLTGENLDEDDDGTDDAARTREVSCVQYFQRLSNLIFTTISEAIRRVDGDEPPFRDQDDEFTAEVSEGQANEDTSALLQGQSSDREESSEPEDVHITAEDLRSMGLDVWSTADHKFVEQLVKFWWNRKVTVESGRVECCGVRIL